MPTKTLLLLCSAALLLFWLVPPWPPDSPYNMAPKAAKDRQRGGNAAAIGSGSGSGSSSSFKAVKKDTAAIKPTKHAASEKIGITGGADGLATHVYVGQYDRWAGRPPAKCDSCSQSTGMTDRHSTDAKPKFLVWTQARRTKASIAWAAEQIKEAKKNKKMDTIDDRFPSGSECYYCYDVRRNFYTGMSQAELDQARLENPAKDDEVNMYRADTVSEASKYTSKVLKMRTLESGDQSFDREYISGTAAKLWDFAATRNLTAETDEDLIDIIKDKHPTYKIMINKRREIVVEIQDQTGGEYRFERGTNEYTEYHKLERFDDADDHKEAHAQKMAKNASKEMDRTVYQGTSAKQLDRASASAVADGNLHGQAWRDAAATQIYRDDRDDASDAGSSRCPSPRENRRTTAVLDPSAASTASAKAKQLTQQQQLNRSAAWSAQLGAGGMGIIINDTLDANVTGMPWEVVSMPRSDASRGRGSTAASAAGGLPMSESPRAKSDAMSDRQSELEDGQGNGLEDIGSPSASGANAAALSAAEELQMCPKAMDERTRQEATKALKAIMADFGSDDQHFDHSRQTKHCDSAISRLRKHARKCSNSTDEELRSFGQQLWDCADEVEERQSLFNDGRTKFCQVVTSVPSAARQTILLLIKEGTLVNFIQREAPKLSDPALGNAMTGRTLFLSLVGHTSDTKPAGIGLHLITGNDTAVKQCQRPIVGAHIEVCFKQPSYHALYVATNNFCGDFLRHGAADLERALEEISEKLDGSEALVFGFCPRITADMICAVVMGEVAKALSTNSRVPGHLHSLIKTLTESRAKLSGRVRCYHKHIPGVSHTARDVWKIMEEVAEKNTTVCDCAADEVDKWTAEIREQRLTGTLVDLLGVLGPIACENKEKLILLGQWLTVSEESGTCSNAELRGCGQNFQCELLEALGKVFKAADLEIS